MSENESIEPNESNEQEKTSANEDLLFQAKKVKGLAQEIFDRQPTYGPGIIFPFLMCFFIFSPLLNMILFFLGNLFPEALDTLNIVLMIFMIFLMFLPSKLIINFSNLKHSLLGNKSVIDLILSKEEATEKDRDTVRKIFILNRDFRKMFPGDVEHMTTNSVLRFANILNSKATEIEKRLGQNG